MSSTGVVTVSVTDAADAPLLSAVTVSVAEDAAPPSLVTTLVATDQDDGSPFADASTVEYTIEAGNDAGAFALDVSSGALRVASAGVLDFEGGTQTYTLTVRVEDDDGMSSTGVVTVSVTDVQEPPAWAAPAVGASIAEHSVPGTLVSFASGNLTASDPDGTDNAALQFVVMPPSDVYFTVVRADAPSTPCVGGVPCALAVKPGAADMDFDAGLHTLSANVSVYDPASGAVDTVDVPIAIVDVNQAPVWTTAVTGGTMLVTEHAHAGTAVGNVSAVDPDGDPIRYTTVSTDGGPFDVDPESGAVYVTAADLNYEAATEFEVRVRVTETSNAFNGSSLEAAVQDAVVTVLVVDANDAPLVVLPVSTISVAENDLAVPRLLHHMQATDEDLHAVTFSIQAQHPERGYFSITPSGELMLLAPLDYEDAHQHVVTVAAQDNGDPSRTSTAPVVVHVQDVNDVPVAQCTSSVVEVSERQLGRVAMPVATAVDPDAGEVVSWTLTWDASLTPFGTVVTESDGLGNFTTYLDITSEAPPYSGNLGTLRPCDTQACYSNLDCSVLITITDLNDPPVLNVSATVVRVPENAVAGTVLATMTVDDQDDTQTHTMSLLNDALAQPAGIASLGVFSVVMLPGTRTAQLLLAAPRLDFEQRQSYLLRVQAEDDGVVTTSLRPEAKLADVASVHVLVEDVVDTPVVLDVSGGSTFGLSTSGNEFVEVSGRHFGSALPAAPGPWTDDTSDESQPNLVVQYWDGEFAGPVAVFNATACRVIAGPDPADASGTIRCLTRPGYGFASKWRVTVSSLRSAPLHMPAATALRYASPSVAAFSNAGADLAATAGNQTVVLRGTQFGTRQHNAITSVTYGPSTDASKYTATNCEVLEDHTAIRCDTVPGVGSQLRWKVTIGNLSSVTPTTNYAPPAITSVSGPGAANASTQGGETVVLRGTNFGTAQEAAAVPSSIDFVQYGRDGDGVFRAVDCAVTVDHTEITCKTAPGTGKDLTWRVSVAGQLSAASTQATAYGDPVVSAVRLVGDAPGAVPRADPEGTSVVEITGANFGRASEAGVVYNGVASSSTVYVSHSTLQFTVPVGTDAGQLRVRVAEAGTGGAVAVDSEPALVAYAAPVITELQWVEGAADEPVVLNVRGSNLGLACSTACLGVQTCPELAVANATASPSTCASCLAGVPAVTLVTSGGAAVPCAVQCMGGVSRIESLLRCRTSVAVQQASLTVSVAASASNALEFDYEALLPVPTLFDVGASPPSAPSTGATVTLSGNALGSFGVVVLVNDMGRRELPTLSYSDSQAVFELPPGQGRLRLSVRIMGSSTETSAIEYAYDRPAVSGVSPDTVLTSGGTVLTVTGSNLGVDLSAAALVPGASLNSVRLGPYACAPVLSWTPSAVTCVAPEGYTRDAGYVVTVAVSQLCSSIGCSLDTDRVVDASDPSVVFTYAPPVVSAVTPNHGPTSGGTIVTLHGSGFAGLALAGLQFDLGMYTLAGKRRALNSLVTSSNHTHVVFETPQGAGAALTLEVVVGAYTVPVPAGFSYDPPVVTAIVPISRNRSSLVPCGAGNGSAAAAAATPCVVNWAPAHRAELRIEGRNFGFDRTDAGLDTAVVHVGGERCNPLPGEERIWLYDDALQCVVDTPLPVGPKHVSVRIASQDAAPITAAQGFKVLCDDGYRGLPGELCVECEEGALCSGGAAAPRAAPGFWMVYSPTNSSATRFPPCRPASACLGDNSCSDGYVGAQCSACQPGTHVRQQFSDGCTPCPKAATAMLAGYIIGGVIIGAVFYKLYRNGPSVAALSIGVDYFQVLAVFAALEINWPSSLMTVFQLSSLTMANVDSTSPECSVSIDYTQKWYFSMFLPVLLGGGLAVAYAVKTAVYLLKRQAKPAVQRKPKKLKGYATLIGVFLAGLNVLYIYLLSVR